MKRFDELPVVIGSDVLSNWIGLREVAMLDSAYVHAAARTTMMNMCFATATVPQFVKCKRPASQLAFLHWLTIRNLFVSKVSIPIEAVMHKRAMSAFFRHAGATLQCIEFIGDGIPTSNSEVVIDLISTYCTNILKLNLSNWISLRLSSMDRLFESTPHLRYLNFSGCTGLNKAVMYMVAKYCLELRFLSLQGCRNLNDMVLGKITEQLPKLQHLDIGGTSVFVESAHLVAEHCPDLRSFNISGRTLWISDGGLKMMALNCQKLGTIDLSFATGSSKDGIISLARGLNKQLKVLHLRGHAYVGDALLTVIAAECPNLTHLSVSHCNSLTDAGILALAEGCRNLQCLELGPGHNVTGSSEVALGTKLVRVEE